MKKIILFISVLILLAAVPFTACTPETPAEPTDATTVKPPFSPSGKTVDSVEKDTSAFGDEDYYHEPDAELGEVEHIDAEIVLKGTSGTLSDASRGTSGDTVTLTASGVYRVTGACEDVTLDVFDPTETGTFRIILENAVIKNKLKPCIRVRAGRKLIVTVKGTNELSCAATSSSDKIDATIWSDAPLSFNGTGSLKIVSGMNGVKCGDRLRVTEGRYTVVSDLAGLYADGEVLFAGSVTNIKAGKEGVRVGDAENSRFYMHGGDLTVISGCDGVCAGSGDPAGTASVVLVAGSLEIESGGGSMKEKNPLFSQKGLYADGDIRIGSVKLTLTCSDDAIHSRGSVSVTDGVTMITSADDGIHADSFILITGGKINVGKAVEGVEGYEVEFRGGTVTVYASDDGISAAGGTDRRKSEAHPWDETPSGKLTFSGGQVHVLSQGDGIDSNGSIYVTDGALIIEGPSSGQDAPIARADAQNCVAAISGGVVLAFGSTENAVNFDTGSQCSALVALRGINGTTISSSDGSGFSYMAGRAFESVLYSSPELKRQNSYALYAGAQSKKIDFSSDFFYTDLT